MSKKNTTSINATTNTTTSTNEKKEGITMSKKNTTATTSTTTSPMTAQEFKQASYDAYLSYVAFIEGKQDSATTVAALSPLMTKYGFTLTVDNLANLLTVKMTAFGKDKGEGEEGQVHLHLPCLRQGRLAGCFRGSRPLQRWQEPCRCQALQVQEHRHQGPAG